MSVSSSHSAAIVAIAAAVLYRCESPEDFKRRLMELPFVHCGESGYALEPVVAPPFCSDAMTNIEKTVRVILGFDIS
jgi:hypothetical protein